MSARVKGIISIVISAFGFALMAMLVRLCDNCGEPIGAFQKSFFRNVISAAIALTVFAKACPPRETIRFAPSLFLRGLFGTIGIVANYYALSHITIAEGQTLNKTAQFFTVLFAWLFLGEKFSLRGATLLALAFTGVLLITKPGFAGADFLPLMMGLLGGIAAGAAYACTRQLAILKVNVKFIVAFFTVFATLGTLPFIVSFGWQSMTISQYLVLFAAGGAALIGQYGITFAYRFAKAGELSVYDYSNIIFTAAFGFLCFGQIPDIYSLFGILLILIAGVCGMRPRLSLNRSDSRATLLRF